jgi:hypothetical protein
MKSVFFLIFLSFVSLTIFSQDLIVTNEDDSINCRITKVKADNIYYIFRYKLEISSTLLPLSKIKTYKYNFYPKSEIPKDWNTGLGELKHFQLAIDGGVSYLTAKIDESISKDLYKYFGELKSGFNIGGSITYYFAESFGFGFKYHRFMTSNRIDNVYLEDHFGNLRMGTLSDDIRVSFFGPSFSTRLASGNKKNLFLLNYSFGYIDYNNNAIVISPYKITGNTLGMGMDIGYDFEITENFLFGFQLSLISGVLKSYILDDGHTIQRIDLEKGHYESLYRIDFSIGIRIAL